MAGLAASNGRLEEACVYDIYGVAAVNGRFVGLPQVPALDPPP